MKIKYWFEKKKKKPIRGEDVTTCDFCSAQACIRATGATPVKHQPESAPLSKKISTFDRRMEKKKNKKKCQRGKKQRKDKSASDVPPWEEKAAQGEKRMDCGQCDCARGIKKKKKKKQVWRADLSNACINNVECVADGWNRGW